MSSCVVKDVVRTVLHVPFHERCADTMEVYGPGWSIVELIEVETEDGVVGIGETIQGYTWGHSREAEFARVRGRNVFEVLWDDSLGAGLQMALFDAAGKHLGVPCHRLMGPQHRDACPVSWWAQSMPPAAWAAEARAAEAHGFTTMKVKARPWYDIAAQLQAVDEATSQHFKLDADFNTMLLGVDQAAPLIGRLERDNACLAIVESPIPQDDVEGNKLLRRKIQSPIAMHIGQPPPMTAIREGVCDGFVIGGGVSRVLSDGNLAAGANAVLVADGGYRPDGDLCGAFGGGAKGSALAGDSLRQHLFARFGAGVCRGGRASEGTGGSGLGGRVGPGCCGAPACRAGLCQSAGAPNTRRALARWPGVVGTGRRVSGRFHRWQNHRLCSGNGPPSAARRRQRRI